MYVFEIKIFKIPNAKPIEKQIKPINPYTKNVKKQYLKRRKTCEQEHISMRIGIVNCRDSSRRPLGSRWRSDPLMSYSNKCQLLTQIKDKYVIRMPNELATSLSRRWRLVLPLRMQKSSTMCVCEREILVLCGVISNLRNWYSLYGIVLCGGCFIVFNMGVFNWWRSF